MKEKAKKHSRYLHRCKLLCIFAVKFADPLFIPYEKKNRFILACHCFFLYAKRRNSNFAFWQGD